MGISLLSVICGLAAYAFAGLIASRLFSGNADARAILCFALLTALCKILRGILLNASTWISHQAAYGTLRDIRLALSEKLLRMPLGYLEAQGSGRLKTQIADHIEGMEKTLAHMLPELTANLLGPLLLAVWMLLLDWRLALCGAGWIFLGFAATSGMMKGYAQKYAGQIEAFKGMNQAIAEYVGGIEVIKNFGQTDACYGKYASAVQKHAQYNTQWQKETQRWSSLGMAIAPYSIFPILIAGLIFYAGGTLDAGTLVLCALLSLGVYTPLMQAMNYFDQLAQLGTNAQEIRDVLDAPELTHGSAGAPARSDIEFRHVTFAYAQSEGPALKDISFHVPEGAALALVGPSGSGKSTAAKLLAGYFDAQEGEILMGGTPISECSQEALCEKIAYVEQETFLFEGTILENIRMGRQTASDAEVMDAARRAGCDAFIRALPNGYQTEAGAAGGRLSGGERQRIAIARAILKDAPILILDEATASADPKNEAAIQQALSAAVAGKTLIVIAHRLSTVCNADQLAFFRDGRIIATGTHAQLLKNCEDYAAMWRLSEEAQL